MVYYWFSHIIYFICRCFSIIYRVLLLSCESPGSPGCEVVWCRNPPRSAHCAWARLDLQRLWKGWAATWAPNFFGVFVRQRISPVGGFKHFLCSIIYGMSSFPLTFIDALIFFRGVGQPPTSTNSIRTMQICHKYVTVFFLDVINHMDHVVLPWYSQGIQIASNPSGSRLRCDLEISGGSGGSSGSSGIASCCLLRRFPTWFLLARVLRCFAGFFPDVPKVFPCVSQVFPTFCQQILGQKVLICAIRMTRVQRKGLQVAQDALLQEYLPALKPICMCVCLLMGNPKKNKIMMLSKYDVIRSYKITSFIMCYVSFLLTALLRKKLHQWPAFGAIFTRSSRRLRPCERRLWRMANLAMLGMVSNGSDCVYRCFTGWWFGTFLLHFSFFPYIGNVIIRTDELIFFRGVGQPPSSKTNWRLQPVRWPESATTGGSPVRWLARCFVSDCPQQYWNADCFYGRQSWGNDLWISMIYMTKWWREIADDCSWKIHV